MSSLVVKRSLPVSQAPADILCSVFQILFKLTRFCDDDGSSRFKQNRENFKDKSIAVTHVCRHWRIVALDFAPIWAFVVADVFPLEQTRQYLARSNAMMLTLYLSIDWWSDAAEIVDEDEKELVKLVKSNMFRVKDLHVSSYAFVSALETYPDLFGSAVNLRCLTCESSRQEIRTSPYLPDYVYKIPLRSLSASNAFASLTEAAFFTVMPDANLSWFDSLTCLWLQNMDIDASHLLKLLAKCSGCLQSLRLVALCLDSRADKEQKIISMSGLSNFVAIGNIGLCTSVMPHLSFPERLNWQIADHLGRHAEPLRAMVDQMENLPSPLLSSQSYLSIKVVPEEKEMEFWVIDESLEIGIAGRQANYEVYTTRQDWQKVTEQFFSRLPYLLPLGLGTLDVELIGFTKKILKETPFRVGILKDVLLKASDIRLARFSVRSRPGVDYIQMQVEIMAALCSVSKALADGSLWPKVEKLDLRDFDFSLKGLDRKASKLFWKHLLLFLRCWRKLRRRLSIQRPINLSRAGIDKIYKAAGAFNLC